MSIKERNSGLELLRILCIWGILCMHLSGTYTLSTNLPTLVTLNVINSLFNICVTCFVLISGYFSITLKWDKLFSLWCIVIFYSLADAAISYSIGTPLTLTELFKSVFPSITGKYWFFTTYMLLAILSPYINKIPQILPQKQFKNLLLLLVAIFYLLPTFFYFEIIKDNGKGPVCMLIVYLIGRYIALYAKRPPQSEKQFSGCAFPSA